jgi:hypothetical protein
MLCLGLLATTPVGSTVPGLILAVMAVQLIVGRGKPAFPHFIMTRDACRLGNCSGLVGSLCMYSSI